MITAYEDTCFYALSGVASEKEEVSSVSGDNFSLFSMENGHYHVCVSDGMGSGPSAFRESDMVQHEYKHLQNEEQLLRLVTAPYLYARSL